MTEYAPEYTKRERFVIVAKIVALAVPIFAFLKFSFFPWFRIYSDNAHCYDYGYFTGTHVVFYFVFVLIPIGSALIAFAVSGRGLVAVIRLGQYPLPGEKVFRPTKYKYGFKARIQPFLASMMLVFMVALGVRGIFWANEIIDKVHDKSIVCE